MTDVAAPFVETLRAFVDDVPADIVRAVATALVPVAPGAWRTIRQRAQGAVSHPGYRASVGQMIDRWQAEAPDQPPTSVALALETAAHCREHARGAEAAELVWTGPAGAYPMRRTAQALQQVIDEARHDLLVVSYAVYQVREIAEALVRAIDRAVAVRLVIESSRADGGRVTYDGLAAFGTDVAERAHIFRWPVENRPRDETGRHGALHVKCAVADESLLLLSSANLTHYALSLNMEMGILVRGGVLPRHVAAHFASLIDKGVIVRTTNRGLHAYPA